MLIFVKNFGTNTVYEVTGKLRTRDTLVVILDSIDSFGNIEPHDRTLTKDNEYKFTVSSNCIPIGHPINFEFICKDNNDSVWISFFSDVTGGAGKEYALHDIGDIKFGVKCIGMFTFLEYVGTRLLKMGSLWLGNSSEYVADQSITVNQNICDEGRDWKVTEYPDGKVRIGMKEYSGQDGWAMYNDNGHPTPKGVTITQRS
jgi:hypothetical protein